MTRLVMIPSEIRYINPFKVIAIEDKIHIVNGKNVSEKCYIYIEGITKPIEVNLSAVDFRDYINECIKDFEA